MIGILCDRGASTENNGIYTINSFPNENLFEEKILNFDISEISATYHNMTYTCILTNKITPPYPTSFCFSHVKFSSFFCLVVPPPLGVCVDFWILRTPIILFGILVICYFIIFILPFL